MWIGHRKEIRKLNLRPSSSEGRASRFGEGLIFQLDKVQRWGVLKQLQITLYLFYFGNPQSC